MKKIYNILALTGAVIWSATIFLRDTSLMDNAVLRRILWVTPNFGVVWLGAGLTFTIFPYVFKREFNPKHTIPLVGGIFAVLILSEIVHHIFLDSAFDIWDMAASAAASLVIIVIHIFRKSKMQT